MEIVNKDELQQMRKVIKMTFIRIGIRCDLLGFNYLCKGVELALFQPKLLNKLTKGLYVEIAKSFNVVNVNTIERSIRSAIENTAEEKSFSEINKLFKAMLFTIDEKPTAGELIRLVAEYYLLELYKDWLPA